MKSKSSFCSNGKSGVASIPNCCGVSIAKKRQEPGSFIMSSYSPRSCALFFRSLSVAWINHSGKPWVWNLSLICTTMSWSGLRVFDRMYTLLTFGSTAERWRFWEGKVDIDARFNLIEASKRLELPEVGSPDWTENLKHKEFITLLFLASGLHMNS